MTNRIAHLLIQADARRIPLPDRSVHCVVTSPPYWGLRDYGTARWEGGDKACDHAPRAQVKGCMSDGGGPLRDKPSNRCRKCGARRIDAQIGLEATPSDFVAEVVRVFREVHRVLRDDGTCFINLGDSFGPGKQLQGIPWRVAFALQSDGWILRSDIIWAKPNPMPESVTDRPTKSHEYLFLMAKRESYYFDAEAVREKATATEHNKRYGPSEVVKANGARKDLGAGRFVPSDPAGRNLRTVWPIATESFPGAHFATYPRKLVEPCVKAGTSERGVCPDCGAPWERVTSVEGGIPQRLNYHGQGQVPRHRCGGERPGGFYPVSSTIGWQPTCSHDRDPIPATVLDPFAGSGTTLVVANALGRRAVGLDLSREYLGLAAHRITRPHAAVPRPGRDEHHPLFEAAPC